MRTTVEIRQELASRRLAVHELLLELEDSFKAEGGYAGGSIYNPTPHGEPDPAGCGACRGTGLRLSPFELSETPLSELRAFGQE